MAKEYTRRELALKTAKQAKGTVNKVIEMIEGEKYCPEVIQQADSVIGLLKRLKRELLAGHLDTCVSEGLQTDKEKTINELLKIYQLAD